MRDFTTIYITPLIAFCMGIPAVYGIPAFLTDDGDGYACTDGTCDKMDCSNWGYPSHNWEYACPNYCRGIKQSPIDICCPSTATIYGPFNLTSYAKPIDMITIKNEGYTVVAAFSNIDAFIEGGGLNYKYTLAHFDFHWGCRSNRGSEHTIYGVRYAMELHFVHYKSSYGNFSAALNHPKKDGIAVFGVLFNVGAENGYLKPITDNLHHIMEAEAEKRIDFNIGLLNLIPTPRRYYRYLGSLTTPTCNEDIIWYVFSTPITISEEQLQAFRMLKTKKGEKLCDNFRDINPLGGRVVTAC